MINMNKLYTDYSPRKIGGILEYKTKHHIIDIDKWFVDRIINLNECPKKLAKEIKNYKSLHPTIRKNLLYNLKNYENNK